MTAVRTRFAPSPTGFIHLGNIRSALYPWAFARANRGTFILRIEDTDVERSSQEAVDVIIDGMKWLGLDHDEGPFYQMQRMARYKEVLAQLLEQGKAYYCYMSTEELDALREKQMAAKQKPRYDGTWRPEPGKQLPPIPEGVKPVVRFRTPLTGVVAWDDKVKGRIEISNEELDDLVIARPDGTPTYNFCVVVDDVDMKITHVIRGDDHVNNTPRQIHVFQALGYQAPVYAHLPTVLNEQGEKMSKRHGAKPVTQYKTEGFLPEAVVNYLARLGWSHGDDEIFSPQQLVEWFNLDHLGKSAGQFDETKLRWVNAQHMKMADDQRLAALVAEHLSAQGIDARVDDRLIQMCALFKDRCSTLLELADWVKMYFVDVQVPQDALQPLLTEPVKAGLNALRQALQALTVWDKESIQAALKATLTQQQLKMPQLAIPVRLLVCGQAQTPSVDAVLELFSQQIVLQRLQSV